MNGDKPCWFQIPVGVMLLVIISPFVLAMMIVEDIRNKRLGATK